MRTNERTDPAGEVAANLTLMVWRPQTRADWIRWYANMHAARTRLTAQPDGHMLIDAYGLDADTILRTVRRWSGPALPAGLFAQWFGTPSPWLTDQPVSEPAADVGDPIPDSDPTIVDRLLAGDRTAIAHMSHQDHLETARRLHRESQKANPPGIGVNRIMRLLHCNGVTAKRLLGEALAAGQPAGETIAC